MKHVPSFTLPDLKASSAVSFLCFAVAIFKAVADGRSSRISAIVSRLVQIIVQRTKDIAFVYERAVVIYQVVIEIIIIWVCAGSVCLCLLLFVYTSARCTLSTSHVSPRQHCRLFFSWPCSQVWSAWDPETKSIQECVPVSHSFHGWISLILAIDPGGHLLSMGVFGYAGYWAHYWEIRSRELLAERRQEILERRQKQMQKIEYLQI